MPNEQMKAMCGVAVNRGKHGWAVDWPSGYTSAMPNEATARACAAALDLLRELKEMVALFGEPSHGMEKDGVDAANAAIAKAGNCRNTSPRPDALPLAVLGPGPGSTTTIDAD